MRPFALTMQSQRLDEQRVALGLLAGAALIGLGWGAWALLGRGPADAAPGQCVPRDREPGDTPGRPGGAADRQCPADELPYPPELRAGAVEFTGADGASITVEIAEAAWERRRGLMFRTSMPADHGLLLTLPQRGDHSVSLRGTCIALDVLFVDEHGTIVDIAEDVGSTTPGTSVRTSCPARHVIEVNAGFCRRHGVRPGQRVRIVGL